MTKNLRLLSITGLIAALSFSALQGCGDDDDDGNGGGAGSPGSGGTAGRGGAAGSGTGGATGGSAGSSAATGGTAGSATGGSAGASSGGAAGSTGGQDNGGSGGASAGAGGGGPSASCIAYCNGPDGVVEVCKDEDIEGKFANPGACLDACANIPDTEEALQCRIDHTANAKNSETAGEKTSHCGHAYGKSLCD